MRILIVDDEPSLRHTLSLILEGEGHEVAAAADGAQALARLADGGADIVLCDLRMTSCICGPISYCKNITGCLLSIPMLDNAKLVK